MLLPTPPRRVTLRAFWILASAAGGLAAAAGWARLGLPAWPLAGAAAAAALAVPGWLRPDRVERPYRLWNRLAEGYSRVARFALAGSCFVVVAAAGLASSSTMMRRPAGSGWVPRPTLPPESYPGPGRDAGRGRAVQGGLRSLAGWAGASGSWWALPLVPLLGLLRMVQTSERGSLGGNIYTLY